MTASKHDTEMRDVYANVYQSSYQLTPEAMDVAMARVTKNLSEFSISASDLGGMNVLNVGPAREAMALHRLGAKNIFHFDISDLAVGAVQRAKSAGSAFDNIQSVQRDLCAIDPLPIRGGVDFVYLSGILHHLHDPSQALANIFACLNPHAKLFFRIYRSGSLYYFCCNFIRKFITYDDRDAVMAEFHKQYREPRPDAQILYNGVWDDFFVPVLNLYQPSAVDRFFSERGFSNVVPHCIPDYDHGNARHDGQGVSLFYQGDEGPYEEVPKNSFPTHVDQLSGIAYREASIQKTVQAMKEFIGIAPTLTAAQRAKVAITVHRLGHIRTDASYVSAGKQHERIRTVLAPYV